MANLEKSKDENQIKLKQREHVVTEEILSTIDHNNKTNDDYKTDINV